MIYSETVVKELNEKQINIAHNTTFQMDLRGSVIPVHVEFNLYYIRIILQVEKHPLTCNQYKIISGCAMHVPLSWGISFKDNAGTRAINNMWHIVEWKEPISVQHEFNDNYLLMKSLCKHAISLWWRFIGTIGWFFVFGV